MTLVYENVDWIRLVQAGVAHVRILNNLQVDQHS